MIRDVITHPNDILRKKAAPLKRDDFSRPEFQQLITDMMETLLAEDGLGLAAPQIDESVRVIIVQTKDGPRPLINPEIIKKSWAKIREEEGCLSVPGVYGVVARSRRIRVRAWNTEGDPLEFNAQGLLACILQHEIDHLDGILFIDKAKKIRQIQA